MFASKNLTLGQINAIVKKLGGEKAALDFLRGNALPIMTATNVSRLEFWRQVKLGEMERLERANELGDLAFGESQYRQAIWSSDMAITSQAESILSYAYHSATVENLTAEGLEKPREVKLVVGSIRDLGMIEGPGTYTYEDICNRIRELGFALCDGEVGLALRLAYDNQPDKEELAIAMTPIDDPFGSKRIFYLTHVDGKSCLDVGCPVDEPIQSEFPWNTDPDMLFVFVLPATLAATAAPDVVNVMHLEISVGLESALRASGIRTIYNVLAYTSEQFEKLPGAGRKYRGEMRRVLADMGLSFKKN